MGPSGTQAGTHPSIGPLALDGLSVPQIREAISNALLPHTAKGGVDLPIVVFRDFAGLSVCQSLSYVCSKLSKDVAHAAHVGWIQNTLADPIEVWDRIDKSTDTYPKRHYFSAYRSPGKTLLLHYVTVAAVRDGTFITAFQKDSGAGSIASERVISSTVVTELLRAGNSENKKRRFRRF